MTSFQFEPFLLDHLRAFGRSTTKEAARAAGPGAISVKTAWDVCVRLERAKVIRRVPSTSPQVTWELVG